MALHRFFVTGEAPGAGVLGLTDADAHHLRDVLRLSAGDEIVVVDGIGAAIVRLDATTPDVTGTCIRRLPARSIPRVTLAPALAKGDKTDTVVRQATELGVARIVPFAAERSVLRLEGAKAEVRAERWRRVAAEAAKQSQRVDVPVIVGPVRVADLPDALVGCTVLVCWEDASGAPGIGEALERAAVSEDGEVAVVVGPEGGLTPGEVALLVEAGALPVSLGATILRTETAAVVAAALALYERGGLGAHGA
jgi:16S rRNA (uracil1498-N3)-methyltransferase